MKNRRFFLDVNPQRLEHYEIVGDVKIGICKSVQGLSDDWYIDIYVNDNYDTGLCLAPEELRALYNILTIEEKEPFDKEEFEKFWEYYHSITLKPKTDKEAALKYWKKLTPEERRKAIVNIFEYSRSVDDKRFLKKARTYLADKNFNDEFKTNVIPSVGKAQSIDDLK